MAQLLFLASALFWIAFLHPYLFYPLSLRAMKARPATPGTMPRPSASLLFSAYNEERALPAKLANIEAIKALYPDLEVIAYSDASSDDTLSLLQSRPDLLRVIPAEERAGKAAGMRRMVESARGDICIYTDANVLLDPSSVGCLLDYFRNPDIGGVSGTLRYVNDADSATAEVGGLYWRLEERIKALESRCGSMMGADGSIFATRRALYPVVPAHLLDDMTVSMSVLFAGLRLISAPDVIAYERNTTDARDEFRRKRRIACRAFNTHRHLLPQIKAHFSLTDRYKYLSHKLLRWLGAPILVAAVATLTAALLMSGLDRLAIGLWVAGGLVLLLGGSLGIRPFAIISGISASILATFIGVTDAWRGRRYQTWSPAKSRD
ncbi:MAG: glycosyltransferase [Sphingomonadales bacterium]|nr:MAG: glycosyltransferase [Sphingomonadales bacterium]TNF02470.1 MAG: glycosyltransferase [Sphingomonadales bacterium]